MGTGVSKFVSEKALKLLEKKSDSRYIVPLIKIIPSKVL